MAQLTLIADGRAMAPLGLPAGFAMRSPRAADTEKLGQLYFGSGVPGARHVNVAEAIQEVRSFFQSEFGDFWPKASGVIERDGNLVAALLAVRRAPWDDIPDCPFITDLFTDQRFRRQGLARTLLIRCLTQASSTARPQVALRVDSGNTPAIHLYQRMGFGLREPQ
jgi:ribosomal protein S18 acetylase RimI-like enzyme